MLHWIKFDRNTFVSDDANYLLYRTDGSVQIAKGWVLKSLLDSKVSHQVDYVVELNLPPEAKPLRVDLASTRGGLSKEQRHIDNPRTIKRGG